MVDVKRTLLGMYGAVPGATYDILDNEKMKNKVELCEEVLELLDKFHPGRNYTSGEGTAWIGV